MSAVYRNTEWFSPDTLKFFSIQVWGGTEWTFLELGEKNGVSGLAEITGVQLSRSAVSLVAKMADRMRGERVHSTAHVLDLVGVSSEECLMDRTLAVAVSGIMCAVADAISQRCGLSLSDYLRAIHGESGVVQDKVRLYANINRSLLHADIASPSRAPEDFAKTASLAVSEGFQTIKCAPFDECKSSMNEGQLLAAAQIGMERVKSIKEAIGDVDLYVDCHSRFTLDSAVRIAQLLVDADVKWMEEPLDPLVYPDELCILREEGLLPIAGAELAYGEETFIRLSRGSLDILMPDVKFCGGPCEAYRIGVELERRSEVSVSMHCPSGPISLLTSGHITAAFQGRLPLEHAHNEVEWRRETIEPRETIIEGWLELPKEPGLGARISPLAIEMHGSSWEL